MEIDNMKDLLLIQEGMVVEDKNGERIGTVSYMQMPEDDVESPRIETQDMPVNLNEHEADMRFRERVKRFEGDQQDTADRVQIHLKSRGFIKVLTDNPVLGPRFAALDNVKSVTDETVTLTINEDELFVV